MNVSRVRTPTGSHIEPPLDLNWDNDTKLRWHAAVVQADTGLPISIHPQPGGQYALMVANCSNGPHTYRDAWTYLNGVSTGARQARRHQPA